MVKNTISEKPTKTEPGRIYSTISDGGRLIAKVDCRFGSTEILVDWLGSEYAYGLASFVEGELGRSRVGVIYGLEVDVDYRRMGIASDLVKDSINLLAKRKVKSIFIQASSELGTDEDVLVDFYKKFGFQVVGRSGDSADDPILVGRL